MPWCSPAGRRRRKVGLAYRQLGLHVAGIGFIEQGGIDRPPSARESENT